jgi:hypothetical protein
MAKKRKSVETVMVSKSRYVNSQAEIILGDFPHLPTLAFALRSDEPVPKLVREFLADFIEGKRKRPRGSPKTTNLISQVLMDHILLHVYRAEYKRLKEMPRSERKRQGSPSDVALERTSIEAAKRGIHLKPDAIKKRLRAINRFMSQVKE